MLFCIVGVTVTVASDSERTYHVAVGAIATLCMLLLIRADCGLPRSWPRLHHLFRQLASVLGCRCLRGGRCWLHPAIHDCGTFNPGPRLYVQPCNHPFNWRSCTCHLTLKSRVLMSARSSGSSTTDHSPRPAIAHSLTHTPCIRRPPVRALPAKCRTTTAPRKSRLKTPPPKCIRRRS